ncbi:MAG: glycoside hydrolase [Flavobacteriales bacterium]|nr:glycoside hydrolase [Flavobacteriales bacterium]
MKIKLIFLIIICTQFSCTNKCDSFKQNQNKFYGIDISEYQEDISRINWEIIRDNQNPKIDFIYLRSTMGKDGVDKSFNENLRLAKKNNFKVGIYHYYRPNEKPEEQFINFLNNNRNIGDMPPVVDIEKTSTKGIKDLRKKLYIFLQLIENHYGVKPIIYAYQKYYNFYLRNHFKEYEFWIARHHGIKNKIDRNLPKDEPKIWGNKCPLIWQYTATGQIKGINSDVDINITNRKIWTD